MNRLIYLDNAATTKMDPAVLDAMLPYLGERYGNPSSLYALGQSNKAVINDARELVADAIGARPEEVYFTSGGTESDNWALKATADAYRKKGNHIITSKIEHHAVVATCEYLEAHGFEVTYLDVDENGFVDPAQLDEAIREDTILVSIIFANNEIGTIEPIKALAAVAHEHGVLFHTDAVQAFAHVPIDVNDLGVDLLSASGHKFNGPKGIGFLYIRKGLKTRSFMHGGDQERRRRAGTENVPAIIGIAKAVELSIPSLTVRYEKEIALRDHLIKRVLDEIPHTLLNGDATKRLPNNANFSFEFIEGESLILMLEQRGILGSSGSACASGSLDPSHVLLAIGLPHEIAHGSLRLTLSEDTTVEDIDYVVDTLKGVVTTLRTMSPLYEDYVQKQ